MAMLLLCLQKSGDDGLIEVKISSNQRGKNLTGLLNLI